MKIISDAFDLYTTLIPLFIVKCLYLICTTVILRQIDSRQTDWLVTNWFSLEIFSSAQRCVWRPLLPYVPNFWHPGTLTLSPERQSARISKITNDGLTRSGTGCFIAVPIWQQWCVKGLIWCAIASNDYVNILLSQTRDAGDDIDGHVTWWRNDTCTLTSQRWLSSTRTQSTCCLQTATCRLVRLALLTEFIPDLDFFSSMSSTIGLLLHSQIPHTIHARLFVYTT